MTIVHKHVNNRTLDTVTKAEAMLNQSQTTSSQTFLTKDQILQQFLFISKLKQAKSGDEQTAKLKIGIAKSKRENVNINNCHKRNNAQFYL